MKINIGTNCGNLQRIDTKGIKYDFLTIRLVTALLMDEINNDKCSNYKYKNKIVIHGWCMNRKRGE